MDQNTITVELKNTKAGTTVCLRIPLDITVNELISALVSAPELNVKMDTADLSKCCLKTENPIALLKGAKPLSACGLRNGTIINLT